MLASLHYVEQVPYVCLQKLGCHIEGFGGHVGESLCGGTCQMLHCSRFLRRGIYSKPPSYQQLSPEASYRNRQILIQSRRLRVIMC